jgi:DNA-binding NarL/FixJ family response regulator
MTRLASARMRVLIADNHPLTLAGIRSLLNGDPEVDIVGEARDSEAAFQMAIELRPAIMVLDFSMLGLNGVEVTRQLLAQLPDCKIVVLAEHEDRSYLRRLIEAGAGGYVLKRSAAEDLRRAIHAVAWGGIYLDPSIAAYAQDTATNNPSPAAAGRTELSEREVEVLRLTVVGHSTKAIATMLKLSAKSIETYKARAKDKLGFHSRVELMGYAVDRGWLAGGLSG